jgi:aminoglycoside phosphotransferase (APT) family kinase protein
VDDAGAPSAVIDWGDVCVGDPSIDLSLYWSLLDPPARAAFRVAYGPDALTPPRLLRARVLALSLNGLLARYALDIADPALLAEALAGLDRTLVDG